MELSLTEVSDILGKSTRQVRYLVTSGKLAGRKVGGRWQIDADSLPLNQAQREAMAERYEVARHALETALAPAAKMGPDARKRTYSVTDFEAFNIGRALYREALDALGVEHRATARLFEALAGLTRGCHCYRPAEKSANFAAARVAAADAVTALLLEGLPEGTGGAGTSLAAGIAERLEREMIPKIGGLLAAQEKRGRRSRYEQFGAGR